MTPVRKREASERWEALRRLDDWLDGPMLVLSVAWLGLLLYELGYGTSALLETFGVAIWIIFALEFALRFALAPEIEKKILHEIFGLRLGIDEPEDEGAEPWRQAPK